VRYREYQVIILAIKKTCLFIIKKLLGMDKSALWADSVLARVVAIAIVMMIVTFHVMTANKVGTAFNDGFGRFILVGRHWILRQKRPVMILKDSLHRSGVFGRIFHAIQRCKGVLFS